MISNYVKIRGKQRLAVLRAMAYPASGSIIAERAKEWADRITYFDLRKIIRDFEISGIITSLNPEEKNGRIYCLTAEGLECFQHYFGYPATNNLIYQGDLESLSKVLRRFLVKKILFMMAATPEVTSFSATAIKKQLRYVHSTSLNLIISTVTQLTQEGYLEMEEVEVKKHLEKHYALTPLGKEVQLEITRMRKPANAHTHELNDTTGE